MPAANSKLNQYQPRSAPRQSDQLFFKMKNNPIFSLAFLILFFASCTKTSIAPVSDSFITADTVSSRSNVMVNAIVANIIIADGTLELTEFDSDLEGLSIAPIQYLDFTDNSGELVSIQVNAIAFDIIIADGTLEFVAPEVNFDELAIVLNQSLIFE